MAALGKFATCKKSQGKLESEISHDQKCILDGKSCLICVSQFRDCFLKKCRLELDSLVACRSVNHVKLNHTLHHNLP